MFGSNPIVDDVTNFLIVYQFNSWRAALVARGRARVKSPEAQKNPAGQERHRSWSVCLRA